MATPTGSGKIPEYTAADVNNWLTRLAAGIGDLTAVALWLLALAGLVVFLGGIWQMAKEGREAAFGGGGGKRYGLVMVICGGGLGSVGVLLLFLAGFLRPAGS